MIIYDSFFIKQKLIKSYRKWEERINILNVSLHTRYFERNGKYHKKLMSLDSSETIFFISNAHFTIAYNNIKWLGVSLCTCKYWMNIFLAFVASVFHFLCVCVCVKF